MNNFIICNASCLRSHTKEQLQEIDGSKSDCIVTKTCTLSGSIEEPGGYYYDGLGAVNNIGMVGPSFEYYESLKFNKPYIISIAGSLENVNTMLSSDYLNSSIYAYEINISCPNISNQAHQYINIDDIPKLNCFHLSDSSSFGVKLPPVSNELDVKLYSSYIRENEYVSYVVCCNTGHRGCFNLDGKLVEGALSGKYLKPIALWNVKMFKKYLPERIRVFGCGGISAPQDVADFKLAGADGVQVGTAFMEEGPDIFSKLR
uniref:Dihydroorotate dehydrogenase n=1 Tax=Marseillevirus LCMAC101 TaxID=2506602 RepID=A0A481YS11_9VIRU|nr:MAG: dihydroorotate dehydrogenase [Marseillevirus LCMAC101]